MYIIIDPTGRIPYRHHSEDIKTAADIVLGFTGEDKDYNQALYIMGGMQWGDTFSNDRFTIICYNETLENTKLES